MNKKITGEINKSNTKQAMHVNINVVKGNINGVVKWEFVQNNARYENAILLKKHFVLYLITS